MCIFNEIDEFSLAVGFDLKANCGNLFSFGW